MIYLISKTGGCTLSRSADGESLALGQMAGDATPGRLSIKEGSTMKTSAPRGAKGQVGGGSGGEWTQREDQVCL